MENPIQIDRKSHSKGYTYTTRRFELNNGNKELTITDLEIADEGWYKCLVKTDEGKAEAPFLLHVLGLFMFKIKKFEFNENLRKNLFSKMQVARSVRK